MKRQGTGPKLFTGGEERVRSEGSDLLKKFFESAKAVPKPKLETKAVASVLRSEVKKDLETVTAQLFGVARELKAGKSVSLNNEADAPQETQPQATEAFHEYRASLNGAESRKDRQTQSEIKQQIEMVLAELKNLKESSDELDAAFKDVVVDEVPEKPGIYHLRFFEGFLKMIMKLREKVDDASIFAKLFRSRKSERKYASMAKKGGTGFTLHHDRAVATQSG